MMPGMTTPATNSIFNKHDLYETCVQSPEHLAPLLRAVHGGSPITLGEDFSGTAALSYEWIKRDGARAIAVDLDAQALGHHADHDRITKVVSDVMDVTDSCDVLFVGNFSIGYMHSRAELIAYLRHARSRMNPGGVFVCDTYGGDSAFVISEVHRPTPLPNGYICRYSWEQRYADPTTGLVTDAIHFRIEKAGVIEHEFIDAFVYEWRLWSVPELRDAMIEAGFAQTQVYAKLADAWDDEGNAYVEPVVDAEDELDDSFIVMVAGRA